MISLFLNPVFRFNGNLDKRAPEIDITKTWIFRSIYIIIIGAVVFVYKRYKKNK